MTFEKLGLSEPLVRAIAAEGYTQPTPIQALAIPEAVAGRDVLGSAQTGTGKTAAFALPLLHRLSLAAPKTQGGVRRIRALVLSPTRELSMQIADSLSVYGKHASLRHTVVVGGVSQYPQVRDLKQGVDILVATPGRLDDLRQQGYIDLRHVEVFVLDEADRMLDMGFLPDIRRIIGQLPEERQTLFFSATMPPAIAELADGILRNPARIRIAPVQAITDLITQCVCFVAKPQKASLLTNIIATQAVSRAIVFTRTKHGADRVAVQLSRNGIRAESIHGDKSQSARLRTLAKFKSNHPPVLVATDVAARGIDVDNVSHVINFDLPMEPETYQHRIGRTGRAGASGMAIAFCDDSERKLLKAIERHLKKAIPVDRQLVNLPVAPIPQSTEQSGRFGEDADPADALDDLTSSGRRPGGYARRERTQGAPYGDRAPRSGGGGAPRGRSGSDDRYSSGPKRRSGGQPFGARSTGGSSFRSHGAPSRPAYTPAPEGSGDAGTADSAASESPAASHGGRASGHAAARRPAYRPSGERGGYSGERRSERPAASYPTSESAGDESSGDTAGERPAGTRPSTGYRAAPGRPAFGRSSAARPGADRGPRTGAARSEGPGRSGPGRSGPGRSGPGRSGPGRSGPGGRTGAPRPPVTEEGRSNAARSGHVPPARAAAPRVTRRPMEPIPAGTETISSAGAADNPARSTSKPSYSAGSAAPKKSRYRARGRS